MSRCRDPRKDGTLNINADSHYFRVLPHSCFTDFHPGSLSVFVAEEKAITNYRLILLALGFDARLTPIMDGQFCFTGEGVGQNKTSRAAIKQTTDSKTHLIFEDLRKSKS